MSDETRPTTLLEAFIQAQARMEQPKKTAVNPAFKTTYAPLDECIAASVPVLNAHGIGLRQPLASDGQAMTLSTVIFGYGESLELSSITWPQQGSPQKVGTDITYYRRYTLCSGLGIASEEDDDGNTASKDREQPKRESAPEPRPIPASQVVDAATLMQIRKLRADIGVDDDLYMQHLEIKHGGPVTADTELSQHEANQLLTQYTTRLKGLEEARKVEEADRLSRVKDELGAEYEEIPF